MPMTFLSAADYRLDSAIGFLHQRNAKRMRVCAEAAFSRGAELNFSQFLALIMIRDGIGSTPGELARAMAMTSGAMTRLLDWLERMHYVTRRRSRADRRSVCIELTPTGWRMIDRLLPRLIAMWNDVLASFEPAEFRELVRLEKKLAKALEKSHPREGIEGYLEPSAKQDLPQVGLG